MKVLVKNDKENDRLKAEEEERRQYESHTIACESCGAKLHYYPDNIYTTVAPYYSDSAKAAEAYIKCPCCDHSIAIPKEVAINDHRFNKFSNQYLSDEVSKIDVLKEGNFNIEMVCDNCESVISFDYRDCSTKRAVNEGGYYTAWTVDCPVCGKNHVVAPYK